MGPIVLPESRAEALKHFGPVSRYFAKVNHAVRSCIVQAITLPHQARAHAIVCEAYASSVQL
jgi:hypothetical protein